MSSEGGATKEAAAGKEASTSSQVAVEEDDKEECGWCKWMKAGGCKAQFEVRKLTCNAAAQSMHRPTGLAKHAARDKHTPVDSPISKDVIHDLTADSISAHATLAA